jgi:hypothetical protein
MKSSAQRVVGIVLSMILGLASQSRAQERTAFVCEGRIGNAATAPGQALIGDFEYDIGTNTAAPYQTGQFAWPTNMPSGTPVPFRIQYTNGIASFLLGTNPEGWLSYPVAEDVFTATNGVGTLNVRTRTVQPGSTVRLQEMTLELAGDPTTYDLGTLVASNNASVTTNYPVAGLPAGFILNGNAIFTWNVNNPPGRSQSAFQISASEWQADLDVDTDRDGTVDNDVDETDEDKWMVARGAFVPVNQWATNTPALFPANALTQFAPLVIRSMGALPAGWSVVLRREGNTHIALVPATAGDLMAGSADSAETNVSVAALATGPVTVYAAAIWDLGEFANKQDSVAKVRLSLRDETGAERASDTVALQVAPIILAWNSLPLERLYCTPEFPSLSLGAQRIAYEHAAVWVQDYMELGTCQKSAGVNLDQVVDLVHGYDSPPAFGEDYIDGRLLAESSTTGFPVWHKATWANEGNGGNIEVFPRYTSTAGTDYPYGRVVMASHAIAAFTPIEAQGLQVPIVLPLNWLAVGHIDEVFSFLNESEVLVADPGLAWQEVIRMVNEPSADKNIRVGTNTYHNAMQNVTNDVNFFFSQTLPVEQTIGIVDSTVEVTQGTYIIGDYLLINREVMLVTNITHTATNRVLWVARHQAYGSANSQHGTAAKIRRLSDDMVANVYTNMSTGADSSPLVKRLANLRNQLEQELDKTMTYRPLPVLFGGVHVTDPVTGHRVFVGWAAATANMVNCVVDGNTIYATNPGNEQFRQLFHNVVTYTVTFAQDNTADDVAAWDYYHIRLGELHCGSNGKRTLPAESWWTLPRFNTWGGIAP